MQIDTKIKCKLNDITNSNERRCYNCSNYGYEIKCFCHNVKLTQVVANVRRLLLLFLSSSSFILNLTVRTVVAIFNQGGYF